MNVRFLVEAQRDVDQAFAWYEDQVVGLGYDFLDELDASIRLILSYPAGFAVVEKDIRRCLLKRFPFSVVYGTEGASIVVVAVAHMKMNPDHWSQRA
jgi:plasmid stabilization system protein ParE